MKKIVTFGEIMMRFSPPGFLRFSQTNNFDIVFGGGESNVAVSLANYGLPCAASSSLPKSTFLLWLHNSSVIPIASRLGRKKLA